MKEKTLWSGGRLDANLDLDMAQLNSSLTIDKRLAQEDVRGSLAWAAAIHQAGILNVAEFEQIQLGLQTIAAELSSGSFVFQPSDEDIHTAVERRLTELIGPTGGKLHTGRSRNDQVATDFRLWISTAAATLSNELQKLQAVILERAESDMNIILPGYTHFQQAQPILLSHWWLSHFWALDRDRERLGEAASRANRCPLGCGAWQERPSRLIANNWQKRSVFPAQSSTAWTLYLIVTLFVTFFTGRRCLECISAGLLRH